MLLINQAPSGALTGRRLSGAAASSSLLPFSKPNPPLFSKSRPKFPSRNPKRSLNLSLATADGPGDAGPRPLSPTFSAQEDETVFVGDDGVPLEGVIQFEKPGAPSKLVSLGQTSFLAGGDVLCLLLFSAIGRFSHGFPLLDFETLRTADPFIAGWVLSAYLLGAFGDDGKGANGSSRAIVAAAKSWAVGIPLGVAIRAAISGHIPAIAFMLVTMGSTGILLIGWRAFACNLLSNRQKKKNDVYKRGSPFELFELLSSLVRRW